MTQELSEKQFVEMFSEKLYIQLCDMVFKKMTESEEWKNDLPNTALLVVFPMKRNDDTQWSLIVEATATKLNRVDVCKNKDESITKGTLAEFGIVKLLLSDEEMPDEALDRYNEYQKMKDNLKK